MTTILLTCSRPMLTSPLLLAICHETMSEKGPLSVIPTKGLTFFYINIQAITNKLDAVKLLILNSTISRQKSNIIFCFAETHLNPTWSDSEISIDGYHCVRRDRTTSKGGGLIVYIPYALNFNIRSDIQVSDEYYEIEYLWIEFIFQNSKSILVDFLYQPDTSIRWRAQFENLLKIADNEHKEILILGDFNCNALDKSKYRFLRQLVSQYQLKQLLETLRF